MNAWTRIQWMKKKIINYTPAEIACRGNIFINIMSISGLGVSPKRNLINLEMLCG